MHLKPVDQTHSDCRAGVGWGHKGGRQGGKFCRDKQEPPYFAWRVPARSHPGPAENMFSAQHKAGMPEANPGAAPFPESNIRAVIRRGKILSQLVPLWCTHSFPPLLSLSLDLIFLMTTCRN